MISLTAEQESVIRQINIDQQTMIAGLVEPMLTVPNSPHPSPAYRALTTEQLKIYRNAYTMAREYLNISVLDVNNPSHNRISALTLRIIDPNLGGTLVNEDAREMLAILSSTKTNNTQTVGRSLSALSAFLFKRPIAASITNGIGQIMGLANYDTALNGEDIKRYSTYFSPDFYTDNNMADIYADSRINLSVSASGYLDTIQFGRRFSELIQNRLSTNTVELTADQRALLQNTNINCHLNTIEELFKGNLREEFRRQAQEKGEREAFQTKILGMRNIVGLCGALATATNSQALMKITLAGGAAVQMYEASASLLGVAGATAMTPIGAVAGMAAAAVTIFSLFTKDRSQEDTFAKTLLNNLKILSDQIHDMHDDMRRLFQQNFENQWKILITVREGIDQVCQLVSSEFRDLRGEVRRDLNDIQEKIRRLTGLARTGFEAMLIREFENTVGSIDRRLQKNEVANPEEKIPELTGKLLNWIAERDITPDIAPCYAAHKIHTGVALLETKNQVRDIDIKDFLTELEPEIIIGFLARYAVDILKISPPLTQEQFSLENIVNPEIWLKGADKLIKWIENFREYILDNKQEMIDRVIKTGKDAQRFIRWVQTTPEIFNLLLENYKQASDEIKKIGDDVFAEINLGEEKKLKKTCDNLVQLRQLSRHETSHRYVAQDELHAKKMAEVCANSKAKIDFSKSVEEAMDHRALLSFIPFISYRYDNFIPNHADAYQSNRHVSLQFKYDSTEMKIPQELILLEWLGLGRIETSCVVNTVGSICHRQRPVPVLQNRELKKAADLQMSLHFKLNDESEQSYKISDIKYEIPLLPDERVSVQGMDRETYQLHISRWHSSTSYIAGTSDAHFIQLMENYWRRKKLITVEPSIVLDEKTRDAREKTNKYYLQTRRLAIARMDSEPYKTRYLSACNKLDTSLLLMKFYATLAGFPEFELQNSSAVDTELKKYLNDAATTINTPLPTQLAPDLATAKATVTELTTEVTSGGRNKSQLYTRLGKTITRLIDLKLQTLSNVIPDPTVAAKKQDEKDLKHINNNPQSTTSTFFMQRGLNKEDKNLNTSEKEKLINMLRRCEKWQVRLTRCLTETTSVEKHMSQEIAIQLKNVQPIIQTLDTELKSKTDKTRALFLEDFYALQQQFNEISADFKVALGNYCIRDEVMQFVKYFGDMISQMMIAPPTNYHGDFFARKDSTAPNGINADQSLQSTQAIRQPHREHLQSAGTNIPHGVDGGVTMTRIC